MSCSFGSVLALSIVVQLSSATGSAPTSVLEVQSNRTGSIHGRVVAADNGALLRGATVRLRSSSAGTRTSTTDASGAFQFLGLPAGRYSITAEKLTMVPLETPQAIELADGQVLQGLEIRLRRGGIVGGRIVDRFGDPVVQGSVTAYGVDYLNGQRRLVSRGSATTDDLGQFRIYGLPRGRYFVAAIIQKRTSEIVEDQDDPDRPRATPGRSGFAPTFFPGTATAAEARPINLEPGQEVLGLDFGLLAARLARVSGRIVDSSNHVASNMVVMLNSARSDVALLGSPNVLQAGADGTFTFQEVPPGEYTLDVVSAVALHDIAESGTGQSRAGTEFASIPLQVVGDDIQGVVIRTSRGVNLSGRLITDGASFPPALLARVRVEARLPIVGPAQALFNSDGPVKTDGTFEIPAVILPRVLRIRGLPDGWILKSVLVNGQDVTDQATDFARVNVARLELVITDRPGSLKGVVKHPSGLPAGGAQVVVFPVDSSLWTAPFGRYFHQTIAGTDGRFTISGLPEAQYLAAVAEVSENEDWTYTDNLERLRVSAVPFMIVQGEVKTLALTLDRRTR